MISNFSILVQSSDPLYTKIPPILLLIRQTGCVCANRHLFQRTGLQKMRELGNYTFYVSRAVWCPSNGCKIRATQHFGRFSHQIKVCQRIGWKDTVLAACRRMRRLEADQNFKLFSEIKKQNLKKTLKHISVNILSWAYLVVPLSGRSNLAGRYFKISIKMLQCQHTEQTKLQEYARWHIHKPWRQLLSVGEITNSANSALLSKKKERHCSKSHAYYVLLRKISFV